jgi:WD40 repeat protein
MVNFFFLIFFIGGISFFDLKKQTQIRSLRPHLDAVNAVKFTPDSTRVVSCSTDKVLKVLDISGSEIFSAKIGCELKCMLTDGSTLFVNGPPGYLKIWNLKTGTEVKQIKGHSEFVNAIVVSRNGSIIVTGCKGGMIRTYKHKSANSEISILDSFSPLSKQEL